MRAVLNAIAMWPDRHFRDRLGVQQAGRLDCLRKSFDLLTMRVENGSDERGEHEMTREGKTWRARLVREASRGRKVPVLRRDSACPP